MVALTNSSGHVVETYAYGPFGETAGAGALGNPLRYTGRAYDAATGLYDNRLRNTHPVLGRRHQRAYVSIRSRARRGALERTHPNASGHHRTLFAAGSLSHAQRHV